MYEGNGNSYSRRLRNAGNNAFMPVSAAAFCLAAALFVRAVSTAPAGEKIFHDENGSISPMSAICAAMNDGLFELAVKLLERRLETLETDHAEYAESLELLARAYHETGRHASLLELLETFSSSDPDQEEAAALLFWRAVAEYRLGSHREAFELTEVFEEKYPESVRLPEVILLRAEALTAGGALPEALQLRAGFEARYPDSPKIADNRLAWSGILVMLGETARAEEKLAGLAEDLSTVIGREAAYRRGRLALEQGNTDQAAFLFREVLALPEINNFESVRCMLALAETMEKKRDAEAALDLLEKVIPLLPGGELLRKARTDASRLMFETGRPEQAAEWLREVIREESRHKHAPSLQLGLARGLLRSGHYEQAAGEFQVYLEAFTNRVGQAQALKGLGWALLALERNSEAAENFEKAARLHDDPAVRGKAELKAGDAWLAYGRFGRARELYEQAAETAGRAGDTNSIARARYLAAETMVRMQKNDEAVAALLSLAEDFPGLDFAAKAMLRVATLHEEENEPRKALDMYERILAVVEDPDIRAQSMMSSGMLHYRFSRHENALALFGKIMEDFPDHPFAARSRYMRMRSYSMQGSEEEAIETARDFLEHHPDSEYVSEVLLRIGEHEFNHNRLTAAKAIFLTLADEHPRSAEAPGALLWAGHAAVKRKNFIEAQEIFSRLVNDYPASPRVAEARFAQAEVFTEIGEFAEALLLFEEVIEGYPESHLRDAAIGRSGDCRFMLGENDPQRYKEAIASYRRLLEADGTAGDIRLQAAYKIGRSYERLEDPERAMEYFHAALVMFEGMQRRGVRPTPVALWGFQRAAFDAAAVLESRRQWRQAVNILQRVVDADVPAAGQAAERIRRLRNEHWLLFY